MRVRLLPPPPAALLSSITAWDVSGVGPASSGFWSSGRALVAPTYTPYVLNSEGGQQFRLFRAQSPCQESSVDEIPDVAGHDRRGERDGL